MSKLRRMLSEEMSALLAPKSCFQYAVYITFNTEYFAPVAFEQMARFYNCPHLTETNETTAENLTQEYSLFLGTNFLDFIL